MANLTPEQLKEYQNILKQVLSDEQAREEILKLIKQHLKETNDLGEKAVDFGESQVKNAKEHLESLRGKTKELRDQIAIEEDLEDIQKKTAKFERLSATATEEQRVKKKALVEQSAAELKSALKLRDSIKDRIKELEKQEVLDAREHGNLTRLLKLTEEISVAREEELETREKEANITDLQLDSFKGIIQSLGLTADKNETWLGQAEQTLSSFQSIGLTLSNVGKTIKDFVNPTNLFSNAFDHVWTATRDVAFQMDSTLASFNKTTGAGGKFNDVIDDVRFGSLSAGVGLQESAEAVEALFTNLSSFNQMSKESQIELSKTTAMLDRMGISSQSTAKNLDISTKSLGMNIDEAVNAQKEIAATATELGLSPGMLADQFTSSIPQLAQYGKQSIQIFKELAAQSKATGISVQSLIGISQQFDTFEGAATAAGKLNAMLGGNLLNSVDLLSASESERIDMLRDSISLSGRNFNELGKFERMAIASAAGIKDMDEASRLFGTSAESFEEAKESADAYALSTQTITKYAQSATSAQEKLTKIIESLSGAAMPLLNAITWVIEKFLKLNDMARGVLGPALIGITGAIYALSKAKLAWNVIMAAGTNLKAAYAAITTFVTGKKVAETVATNSLAAAEKAHSVAAATSAKSSGGIANALADIGKKGKAAVPVILAFGFAFLMVGAGIAIAALGMAQFVGAFVELKPEQIWGVVAALGVFSLTLIALAAIMVSAGAAAAIPLLAFGLSFLMIGAGVALAASGMALFVKAFTFLIQTIVDNIDAIPSVALGITSLSFAMGALAMSSIGFPFIAMAFGALTLGILALSGALLLVKTSDLQALASMTASIERMNGDNILSVAEAFKTLGASIKSIGALSNEEIDKTINVIQKTTAVGAAMVNEPARSLAAPIGAAMVNEPARSLAATASGLQTARVEHLSRQEEIVKKISETKQSEMVGSNKQGSFSQVPVILQIDGREFGRAVINVFDRNMKLNMV